MSAATAFNEAYEPGVFTIFPTLPEEGQTIVVCDYLANLEKGEPYEIEILWVGRPRDYAGQFVYRAPSGQAYRRMYMLHRPDSVAARMAAGGVYGTDL